MKSVFKEFTNEKWEQIRTDPYFVPLVASVSAETERMMAEEPPRLRFSHMNLFITTGDRSTYQRTYNAYVNRLLNYSFMYYLSGDEKYIEPLEDILWNICDFESWTIPAHQYYPGLTRRRTNLDLTSTKMGLYICEILHFMGDKLHPLVRERAEREVRERILAPYVTYEDFGWMRTKNNWAAVCSAGVLACYLYLGTKEEIDLQLPRLLETVEGYLLGFDDEGCCKEGYSYWNYGFSFFCIFADMLRSYTDGEIDLFKRPKVHAIARFQENVALDEVHTVPFSDAGFDFCPQAGISHFLKKEYPDLKLPPIPPSEARVAVLHDILWQEPSLADSQFESGSFIYHENQWFIYKSDAYNFACKAGCNAEFHNHNDVGSFVISKDNVLTLIDLGSGAYTRQYFSSERYTILEPSSRSHSVPIINGEYQQKGDRKSTVLEEGERVYSFTMDNAYEIPELTSLVRTFECGDTALKLTDTYEFSQAPTSVVERFSTLLLPRKIDEGVMIGESLLSYDEELFDVCFSSEPRTKGEGDVYFVDLTVKKPTRHMSFTFRFI